MSMKSEERVLKKYTGCSLRHTGKRSESQERHFTQQRTQNLKTRHNFQCFKAT